MKTIFNNRFLLSIILAMLVILYDSNAREHNYRNSDNRIDSKSQRDGKVFSLFSIVTFKNGGCQSQSGTTGFTGRNRNGTCYTASECTAKSGTASGSCAAGFGVCCIFVYTGTSTTITENCSYIQNPSFPSAYTSTSSLTYKVAKCQSDVCWLRLDFETFSIEGPTSTSDVTGCVDSFISTVSPSGYTHSKICGENAGEHIYLNLGTTSSATASLAFTFGTTTSTTRSWEIKVTQIECWNEARPYDSGCLQYHTGTQGRITSFNFPETSIPQHLESQNQNVCIRQESGYCCVRYNLCADTYSFAVATGPPGTASSTQSGSLCTTDYVSISGVSGNCEGSNVPLTNRICGYVFGLGYSQTNAALSVCDCSAPFQLTFVSNAVGTEPSVPVNPQRGFCFEYQQIACSS